ncbi:unnamed protein product [Sympodiomycopsis kandeliae]
MLALKQGVGPAGMPWTTMSRGVCNVTVPSSLTLRPPARRPRTGSHRCGWVNADHREGTSICPNRGIKILVRKWGADEDDKKPSAKQAGADSAKSPTSSSKDREETSSSTSNAKTSDQGPESDLPSASEARQSQTASGSKPRSEKAASVSSSSTSASPTKGRSRRSVPPSATSREPPSLDRVGPLSNAARIAAVAAQDADVKPVRVHRGRKPLRRRESVDSESPSGPPPPPSLTFKPRTSAPLSSTEPPEYPKVQEFIPPKASDVNRPPLRTSPFGTVTFDSTYSMYSSNTAWDPRADNTLYANDTISVNRIREDFFRKPRRYVSLLMDADSLYFNLNLIRKGFEGGQEFYTKLVRRVIGHLELNQTQESLNRTLNQDHRLSSNSVLTRGASTMQDYNISFRLIAFANRTGLYKHFSEEHSIDPLTFKLFHKGILASSPWSLIVDAGATPQAADNKLKVFMLDMLSDQDCLHLYLGGLNDYGYADELDVLRRSQTLNRVSLIFLPGPALKSRYYKDFEARVVQWNDCFDDLYSVRKGT